MYLRGVSEVCAKHTRGYLSYRKKNRITSHVRHITELFILEWVNIYFVHSSMAARAGSSSILLGPSSLQPLQQSVVQFLFPPLSLPIWILRYSSYVCYPRLAAFVGPFFLPLFPPHRLDRVGAESLGARGVIQCEGLAVLIGEGAGLCDHGPVVDAVAVVHRAHAAPTLRGHGLC